MKKANEKRVQNRRSLKVATLMLAAVTVILWLVLLGVKFVTTGVSFAALLDDIIANILGILPPIILFNFVYEYLSKDYVADEMSTQMMETLTGNTEMLDTFKDEVKQQFLQATIKSITGPKDFEMAYGVIEPYVGERKHNIRLNFKYNIRVSRIHDSKELGSDIFSPREYCLVNEYITYEEIVAEEKPFQTVSIGFFVDNAVLEEELMQTHYIFKESLTIHASELQQLIALPQEAQMAFVRDCLDLQCLVDESLAALAAVRIDERGIMVDLELKKPVQGSQYCVFIDFQMPQLKKRSELLVSFNVPTYAPEIAFFYDKHSFDVTVYQFLNENSKLSRDAGKVHGQYIISPKGWIYPVKGVLFMVADADERAV